MAERSKAPVLKIDLCRPEPYSLLPEPPKLSGSRSEIRSPFVSVLLRAALSGSKSGSTALIRSGHRISASSNSAASRPSTDRARFPAQRPQPGYNGRLRSAGSRARSRPAPASPPGLHHRGNTRRLVDPDSTRRSDGTRRRDPHQTGECSDGPTARLVQLGRGDPFATHGYASDLNLVGIADLADGAGDLADQCRKLSRSCTNYICNPQYYFVPTMMLRNGEMRRPSHSSQAIRIFQKRNYFLGESVRIV